MKLKIHGYEGFKKRSLERARKMDRGEKIAPSRTITFETPMDIFEVLTAERIRLCVVARTKPYSVTGLAAALKRDPKSVRRDVVKLEKYGVLRTREEINPGHGRVKIVEPVAKTVELRAALKLGGSPSRRWTAAPSERTFLVNLPIAIVSRKSLSLAWRPDLVRRMEGSVTMARKRGAENEPQVPDLEEELSKDEVASSPSDTGDPEAIVQAKVPRDIRERYEIYSYRNAATILSETRATEFADLLDALRQFALTTKMIRTAGGNESEIPKSISNILRPKGWYETVVQGDLIVKLTWRQQKGSVKTGKRKGAPVLETRSRSMTRSKYLDGHKIDYVKDRVAFDLEWNSKDQTFDRDLYAFASFFQTGVIDVGVLVTRSESLNDVFRALGQALKKDGVTPDTTSSGTPRMTIAKYGASTTWMGKLLYRLNAGRNGGCPVLVVGITPKCISDWPQL